MITSTFQILEGVGKNKEQALWRQGICAWDNFLSADKVKGISSSKKEYFNRQLLLAKKALYSGNSSYFSTLPDAWRLYGSFKEEAIFLDIETTGAGKNASLTLLGLYDGISTKTMVNALNFDEGILGKELSRYKLLLTFNGSSFDLPFIKKRYGIIPPIPHIDIRHCCAKIGLNGGLKSIEAQLGIKRSNPIVETLYGGDPVTLWRMYKGSGDPYYLNLLIEYNEEDVINLKKIMNYCYEKLGERMREEMKGRTK